MTKTRRLCHNPRRTVLYTMQLKALLKTIPRFLPDEQGVTSCANNLVRKHFEISRGILDPINKKNWYYRG